MIGLLFDLVTFVFFSVVWPIIYYVGGLMGIISLFTYVLVQVYQAALPVQNLKQKYPGAEWALVTGGSSGIGKAIAARLLDQGLNVVIAARDDPILKETVDEFRAKYKDLTIRSIPVDLSCSKQSYMDALIEGTKDITVQLLFNNAGYIFPGLFSNEKLENVMKNFNCLAACNVPITHHFLRKMQEAKKPGLITFTSSAAAYLLGPTATMYSASKAFITNFATTLAAENRDIGVDVTVVHPSPIMSNFYKGTADQMANLKNAMKMAQGPDVIAQLLFRSAGRLVVVDQGIVCAGFRLANKVADFAFLNELAAIFASKFNEDHVAMRKKGLKLD